MLKMLKFGYSVNYSLCLQLILDITNATPLSILGILGKMLGILGLTFFRGKLSGSTVETIPLAYPDSLFRTREFSVERLRLYLPKQYLFYPKFLGKIPSINCCLKAPIFPD